MILPSVQSVKILIMTSSSHCGYVLATDSVDSSASIQPLFLELDFLQRPIEDIKKKTYHLQLLAQIWRRLQDFHIFFHSLLQTASFDFSIGIVISPNYMTHFVISPNFIPSTSCAFSGALSFSLALISSSVVCVIPQSM